MLTSFCGASDEDDLAADGAAGDSRVQVDSEGRMGLDSGPYKGKSCDLWSVILISRRDALHKDICICIYAPR